MNGNQFEHLSSAGATTNTNPRYANKSSNRLRMQLNKSGLSDNVGSGKRPKRQIQSARPLEYTIYLAPEQIKDDSFHIEPQIRSIYPVGHGKSAQNRSCNACLYPSNSIKRTNPTQYITDPVRKSYQNYAAVDSPVLSNGRTISESYMNPTSRTRQTTCRKSPSVCHCPIKSISSQVPSQTRASNTPKTIALATTKTPTSTSITTPALTSTVPIHTCVPFNGESTEPSVSITKSSSPTNKNDIPIATDVPITANTTTSVPCKCLNGNGNCGIVIKKAIILTTQELSPEKISTLVNALKLENNEEDLEITEDKMKPINDQITSTNGTNCKNRVFIHDAIVKPFNNPESKIVALLEEILEELRKPKRGPINLSADDISDHDYVSGEDSTAVSFGEQNNHNCDESTDPNGKDCKTGEDLVEACRNLSETILSYQDANRNKH